MDTGKQLLQDEGRRKRAINAMLRPVKITDTYAYFDVLKYKAGKWVIAYIGKITKTPSLGEYCTCPDQFHRNNKEYQDTHGTALQCKHMIKFRSQIKF